VTGEVKKLEPIRRIRRWVWVWSITILPAVLIAWLTQRPTIVVGAVAMLWTAGLAISIGRARVALCPRCGARFFAKGLVPIGSACASCGLRLKQRRVVYPTLE
jgi:hypothetical protein